MEIYKYIIKYNKLILLNKFYKLLTFNKINYYKNLINNHQKNCLKNILIKIIKKIIIISRILKIIKSMIIKKLI